MAFVCHKSNWRGWWEWSYYCLGLKWLTDWSDWAASAARLAEWRPKWSAASHLSTWLLSQELLIHKDRVLKLYVSTHGQLAVLLVGVSYTPVGMQSSYSLSSQEVETATRVQNLDETDCISHSPNTLGKGMNPNILPPAMGK